VLECVGDHEAVSLVFYPSYDSHHSHLALYIVVVLSPIKIIVPEHHIGAVYGLFRTPKVTMSALIGQIQPFQPETDDFEKWVRVFEQFFVANDIKKSEQKEKCRAIFCATLGPQLKIRNSV
jgi:hypothetical protein